MQQKLHNLMTCRHGWVYGKTLLLSVFCLAFGLVFFVQTAVANHGCAFGNCNQGHITLHVWDRDIERGNITDVCAHVILPNPLGIIGNLDHWTFPLSVVSNSPPGLYTYAYCGTGGPAGLHGDGRILSTITYSPTDKTLADGKTLDVYYNFVPLDNPGSFAKSVGDTVSIQITPNSAPSGSTPITFTATGLPKGLSISSSGLISGTLTGPACNASCPAATVTATQGNQIATTQLLIQIYLNYNLTVSKSGTGAATSGVGSSPPFNCQIPCTQQFRAGASDILTANPGPGDTFDGWSGACTNTTGTCTVTMDADKSVDAKFTHIPPATGTIIINATKDGVAWGGPQFLTAKITDSPYGAIDCQDMNSGDLRNPLPLTLANVFTGLYTFKYCSGGPPGTTLASITPGWSQPNQTSTQNLTKGGTITFTFNFVTPAVTSCPTKVTCTWSKDSGPGTVTFAHPNALDTTASFSTDGIYVLRLTADDGLLAPSDTMTVTVQPTPNTYTLTVNSSGAAGISITGSPATYGGTTDYSKTSIAAGTSITLTAPTTASSKNFSNWTGNCDSPLVGRDCTVTMSASKTVTANYAPPTFDYSLSANPNTLTIEQGESTSTVITATIITPPTKPVTLSASVSPAEQSITASFSSNPCSPTCTSKLTINTTSATPPGIYNINVTGSPLNQTTGTTITVTVTPKVIIINPLSPTLTFWADQVVVPPGSGTTLRWTVGNDATSCTAGRDWSGPVAFANGSHSQATGNLFSGKTYTLFCTNSGGNSPTETVPITITASPVFREIPPR